MVNTDYLSSMTLVQWKLFNEDERLSLYKKSAAQVGKFTSSISQLELNDQADKVALKSESAKLQSAKDNVEKL